MDTYKSRATLKIGNRSIDLFRLDALSRAGIGDIATLPYSIRVLLENLLRNEDGKTVTKDDIAAVAKWDPTAKPSLEVAFRPARVLLQDFTGVPAVVDMASMREAFAGLGGDAKRINPLQPADLVIDHSVQVDYAGTLRSFEENAKLEYERNMERYRFLRWGSGSFDGLRVVPPDTGIVHQVNVEYLAQVVFTNAKNGTCYPDTVVGTDSHTTMVNGLGVLGWGVGGIEAEAAMLGQPQSMLLPQVVGFKLSGKLREGATATDLVLTVTQMLRAKKVVGKFVEFCGAGLDALSLADRLTLANMAPEYGATMGFFPVDKETIAYLRATGRDAAQVELVERYCKEQGLFRTSESPEPRFSDLVTLDLGTVVPAIAGPKRPQDLVHLTDAKRTWRKSAVAMLGDKLKADPKEIERWTTEGGALAAGGLTEGADCTHEGASFKLHHGSVVIAAITSCTNTSNPSVMLGAGLVAKRAVERGLMVKPWVKTSLAPGSQVVTDYLNAAGLTQYLDKLRFNLVAYGCTTCIGNSGPVADPIAAAVKAKDLIVSAVLSGNRNFEGRINPVVRANWLASPPLVVAYALAGTVDIDFEKEAIGTGSDGKPVFLRDIWPSQKEVTELLHTVVKTEMYAHRYAHVNEGDAAWQAMSFPKGDTFEWDDKSTYIRRAPFFDGMTKETPPAPKDIVGARVLALLGDSVTTDHISPAGSIKTDSPAGRYLQEHGVGPRDFNSYGARRGNHEVMVRGTFANVRLKNELVPGVEGNATVHLPDGAQMSIYDAAMKYAADHVPLVVVAGKEYGTGSSRDWAAKGTLLLGVRAVIAESFERIHRSNLVGMGVLPLEFLPGETRATHGLTGRETFAIRGIEGGIGVGKQLTVEADGKKFQVVTRIDTPQEVEYYLHRGILPYVLRQMAKG
jgi:aconitate hydratase